MLEANGIKFLNEGSSSGSLFYGAGMIFAPSYVMNTLEWLSSVCELELYRV